MTPDDANARRGRASVPGSGSGRASVPAPGRASVPAAGRAMPPNSMPPNAPKSYPPPAPSRPLGAGNGFGDDPRRSGQRRRSDRRNGGALPPELMKKLRRKRRIRRITLTSLVVVLLLMVGAMGAGYAAVQVPLPSIAVLQQTSYAYYSDGTTELAKLVADENREYVKLKNVPKHVQQAVVAAEDRSFWKNDGISIKGIMRAIWANVTGQETQGASTITQQYVKNAFLSHERTFSRKMKEIVLAVKMDREYSKDQILEFYLNTIYFGRGSYGIEAAAKSYFGVGVKDLTVEQAAYLAGIIKAPENYDPEKNKEGVQGRFTYVLKGMKAEGWYKGPVKGIDFPTPIPKAELQNTSGLSGVSGTIMTRVRDELLDAGFSEREIFGGGLRITTTIDKSMQDAMNQTVDEYFKQQQQQEGLGTAMVAVEPGTGKVKAYWGGENGYDQWDYAGPEGPHQPGSSFKAFVLAAALEQDISAQSKWDSSSPMEFKDRPGKPVYNASKATCNPCTLEQSTVQSLNTPFYAVAEKIGADTIVELAERAGIQQIELKPSSEFKAEASNSISLGQYRVSVEDQANAFATFAANGMYSKSHFVEKVVKDDQVVYEANPTTSRAFSEDVAADATNVMVKDLGNSNKLSGNRAAAAKTGTHQYGEVGGDNAHAWMCGYTPQLSTAVWVGNTGDDGPIRDQNGNPIYGSGLPGKLWKTFMDKALKGQENQKFLPAAKLGDDDSGNAQEPSPTPTAEDRDRDNDNQPAPNPDPQRPGTEQQQPTFGPLPRDQRQEREALVP